VFVAAQYDEDSAASLMIFQDGWAWAELDGAIRTPIVLENLIAAGEMPVTIAVFVDPGVVGRELPAVLSWAQRPRTESLSTTRSASATRSC
jgi:enterochelin esterase family protein